MSDSLEKFGSQDQKTLAPRSKIKGAPAPCLFMIELTKDDYTPRLFVMAVLIEVLGQSHAQAMSATQILATEGQVQVGPYTRDIAATRLAVSAQWARIEGHPLKLALTSCTPSSSR